MSSMTQRGKATNVTSTARLFKKPILQLSEHDLRKEKKAPAKPSGISSWPIQNRGMEQPGCSPDESTTQDLSEEKELAHAEASDM
jgi:hypothetical protein